MEKKQIPLRLSKKLYDQIASWAEDDFRSVNGQIEYLLTECVKQRSRYGERLEHSEFDRYWQTRLRSDGHGQAAVRRRNHRPCHRVD